MVPGGIEGNLEKLSNFNLLNDEISENSGSERLSYKVPANLVQVDNEFNLFQGHPRHNMQAWTFTILTSVALVLGYIGLNFNQYATATA